MDDNDPDTLANRDTPVPMVEVHPPGSDDPSRSASASTTPSADSNASRHRFSASKLKDKLESLGDSRGGRQETPNRVSDKLFNIVLSNIIPSEDLSGDDENPDAPTPKVKDRRSRDYVARPSFSIPVMSSNFRRFNSRIGVAFVFQNRLIRLFTWRQPTQTISFLFVWTFVCINPYLLPVLPLACCLFFIMVPAYLARHPPPPTHISTDLYPLGGPPLADARSIRPAPELSKDFFRNMRDLQNAMEDFSRVHDAILAFLTPLTNFSNEALSSLIYLLLLLTSCLLFISAHLLPWRLIFLLLGYAATILAHPFVQDSLLASGKTSQLLSETEHQSRSRLLAISKNDIELETSQDRRQVEVFELQHRPLHDEHAEYEAFLFSASSYAPLSPTRISGSRPQGAPFFEDVLPPRGWRWSDKKWTLDLLSREWVEERCVTGVEVEIEGERWVTDLHYEALESDGERERRRKKLKRKSGSGSGSGSGGMGSRGGRDEMEKEVLRRAWASHAPSRKGEWRRRRWVREVERMPVVSSSTTITSGE